MKNGKVASINVKPLELFQRWMEFTRPFHKLPDQHSAMISQLLYYNYEYGKSILEESLNWKMVFNYDTKAKIKESMGIKDQQLQNILSALRKKGIIKNNQVVNSYIPNIEPDSKSFTIIFNLNMVDGK